VRITTKSLKTFQKVLTRSGKCATIRPWKGQDPEGKEVRIMMNHIEYGTADTTIVYLVNDYTREDIISMPVLFKENRFVMGTILSEKINHC
jgi:hypothetical protein